MGTKVYYAKMNETPAAIVQKELALLHRVFGAENVLMHNGGKYNGSLLEKSEIVFVTGYNLEFKGKGVCSQIETAKQLDIDIYLMSPCQWDDEYDEIDYLDPAGSVNDVYYIHSVVSHNSADWMRNYGKVLREMTPDNITDFVKGKSQHRCQENNSEKSPLDSYFS